MSVSSMRRSAQRFRLIVLEGSRPVYEYTFKCVGVDRAIRRALRLMSARNLPLEAAGSAFLLNDDGAFIQVVHSR
jgi:hypothetical protein